MTIKNNLPEMFSVSGLNLGTACAGIKYIDHKDFVIMSFPESSHVAGVFTQNAFCAAPVHIAKQHLQEAQTLYFVINRGNANAGTGQQGFDDTYKTCEQLAHLTEKQQQNILPFSTGVIGETLPVDKLIKAMPEAISQLSEQGWQDAAQGILTTDTCTKGASTQVNLDGHIVNITGISKGSGMIRPDMATMLAFVATDANIKKSILQYMLKEAVNNSFNRITVDGDTSTNDSCIANNTRFMHLYK